MMRNNPLGRVLLLALALVVLLAASGYAQQQAKQAPKASKAAKSQSKEAPPPVKLELEPKAIDLIKEACSRLAAARSMSFTAVVTYESPSRMGTPLAYTTKSEVLLQRPDKLRVITSADGPASEFYYDGKTMTAFSPAENLVAVAVAPPTIDATLKAAYDSAAIYFPFTDLYTALTRRDCAINWSFPTGSSILPSRQTPSGQRARPARSPSPFPIRSRKPRRAAKSPRLWANQSRANKEVH